jgi:antitoxin VapB
MGLKTGALEALKGRARISGIADDGTPEHFGGTEVFLEDGKTVERNGKPVFLDEEGGEWPSISSPRNRSRMRRRRRFRGLTAGAPPPPPCRQRPEYIHCRIYRRSAMPHIAKVFQSGNSQAVRLPKDFRFDVDEVEVSREGDALILRPKHNTSRRWASLHAAIERGVSADFMAGGREQPEGQARPDLDRVFP